jgi:hypothetical protein
VTSAATTITPVRRCRCGLSVSGFAYDAPDPVVSTVSPARARMLPGRNGTSARARSAALCTRRFTSFSRQRSTRASSSAGASGRAARSGGGGSATIFARLAEDVGAANAARPVSSL